MYFADARRDFISLRGVWDGSGVVLPEPLVGEPAAFVKVSLFTLFIFSESGSCVACLK